MAISGINHLNIRTLDIAATVRFYTYVLGLTYDGPRQVDGFARHWLRDSSGAAILHLREMAPEGEATGALDHIALACDNMPGVIGRLEEEAVRFASRDNPTDGVVQLFLRDPNGIALELNFPLV